MPMECETENGFRKRRVCIIGAGMSGLVATKYLLNLNMDPIVFEVKQGIGGVWRETFASTGLQTPRPEYEFTDFPWPNYVTAQHPTYSEVMDYFQRYAVHFGLLDHIHFNYKVEEIRYIGQEYCERSLEHAGLWSKNGGPYADSAVWDVGVQKSNGESIEGVKYLIKILTHPCKLQPIGKWPCHFEGIRHKISWACTYTMGSKSPKIVLLPTYEKNNPYVNKAAAYLNLNLQGPYADSALWDVGVHKSNGEPIEWHRFDFLVLCIGKYGDLPKIPSFPPNKGPEVFQGKVLHTMDYSVLDENSGYELIKGKRVVVIGSQKSALDFAVECAEANRGGEDVHPCTMVFRKAHWGIISYELFGLPLQFFYNTRFAQFLLGRPAQGFLHSVLSHLFRPLVYFSLSHRMTRLHLRWAIFKFMELYLCWKLSLRKHGLVPDHSFFEELSSCNTSTYPDNLFSRAEEGCILFRKSPNWSFSSKGVILDDGTEVETDLVVFATGYDAEKKLKSLLPEPFADVLENSAGVVPLYRSGSESLSNLYSSEMRSRWLSHFLSGKFVLPSMKEIEADIDNHSKHWKRITPFYWKSCHAAFQIWDNDNLCRDMGWNPMRKKNWFCELFSPYSNLDYREM